MLSCQSLEALASQIDTDRQTDRQADKWIEDMTVVRVELCSHVTLL